MDVWALDLGTNQGRIQPQGWDPPEGTFVFALGADAPGTTAALNLGDYIETYQRATLTGVKMVRVRARLRPPASMPAGVVWEFSLRIGDTVRARQLLEPGRPRERAFAANVAALSGAHVIALRLTLVSA